MHPRLLTLLLLGCGPSTPDDSDAADLPTPDCPGFGPPELLGIVASPPATEVSGLAVVGDHLWIHNDSGEAAQLHALDRTGQLLSTWTLEGVDAIDFEDMAAAPAPDGGTWLWVGDIGDNTRQREFVTVYGLPEPDWTTDGTVAVQRFDLIYPDGARDAETLVVDPDDNSLWLVEKSPDPPIGFFRALRPIPGPQVLERAAELPFGTFPLGRSPILTGGDLTVDGFTIRSYLTDGLFWVRRPGESLIETIGRNPCPFTLAGEPQPEAIGIGSDGVYTISEGISPGVNLHPYR